MSEGSNSTPTQNGAYFYYDSSANAVKLDTGTSSLSTKLTIDRDTGNATFAGVVKLAGNGTDNDSFAINFTNGACAIARDNNDLELHAFDNMIFGVSNTSYPTSTERMRITSAGKVGINTTSPGGNLHVVGASGGAGQIYLSDADNGTGTNDSLLISKSGTSVFIYNRDNGNINFGTNDVSSILTLDSSQNATFAGNVNLADSKKILLGNSSDLEIFHDGSHSRIKDVGTGHLILNATDFVVNNSGDSANMIIATDGGSVNLYHSGNKKFETSSTGATVTGNLEVSVSSGGNGIKVISQNNAEGFLIFGDADDNSMGGMAYNNSTNSLDIDCNNAVALSFDSSRDATFAGDITMNSSTLTISGTYPRINLTDTNNNDDFSIINNDGSFAIFNVTDALFSLLIDTSNNATFAGNISLADTKQLILGNANDFSIVHDGTETFIANDTGNLTIVNNTNDGDIIFKSDNGSGGTTEYFRLDGGNTNMVASKTILFEDSVKASFGNSEDLRIKHDGTNSSIQNLTGNLTIRNDANDKDVELAGDDGSGGVTPYMTLDGSDAVLRIHKRTIIDDSVKLDFGNGQDLQIYHDSANSYVEQVGTGDLIIRNSTDDKDIRLQTDNGSGLVTDYILLDGSDVSTKILTQKVILSNLPTSDPNNAGQLYNESGFLRVSAG